MMCKIVTVLVLLSLFRLSFSSLRRLTSLTDLNLSGNNIQLLPQTALSSMENLQTLSVHSNRLRAIPDLRQLNSLKVIYYKIFYLIILNIEDHDCCIISFMFEF